jgi:translation initiation factor 1
MSKKNKPDTRGFIFSTDPSFRFEPDEEPEQDTLIPAQQKLRIRLDTKQRAGKAVTLITGFMGKGEDLNLLGKQLKNFCGTGGSVKDNEAIVQGDQREKVLQWLIKNGYTNTKRV